MEERYIVIGTATLAADIAQFLAGSGLKADVWEKKYSEHSVLENNCRSRNLSYRLFASDNEMSDELRRILAEGRLKVVSAVNTYIFPKDIVEDPGVIGINYHNALLPRHRGMNAEAWAIYSLDRFTGITWHVIASDVDKGEILCTRRIPISSTVTSVRLLKQQADAAMEAFREIADDFINNRLKGYPQPQEKTEFHFIKDVPNGGCLDTDWSEEKISAFLRAMDYGILFTLGKPYLYYQDRKYHFRRYRLIPQPEPFADDVVSFDNNSLTLNKKGGYLSIIIIDLKESQD